MKKDKKMSVAEAGSKGGKALAAKMSAEERSAKMKNAIRARWEKWRREHGRAE